MAGKPGSETPVLGVVLAGGQGRRLGGSKAIVHLRRRPLISYPVQALWRAVGTVVVVAKIGTELPPLPGVQVWVEPDEPQHPLTGLVHALSLAGGRPVLVCACDLPLVTPDLAWAIASTDPGGAPAVVASAGGRLQPLLGCYRRAALAPLTTALRSVSAPLTESVAALHPRAYEVEDPRLLSNVNTPEDLLHVDSLMRAPRRTAGGPRTDDQPNVKS